jgi:hypothetical protein
VTQDAAPSKGTVRASGKPRKKNEPVSKQLLTLDPRFGEVKFLVEATHFEKFALWERNEKYKEDPKLTSIKTRV